MRTSQNHRSMTETKTQPTSNCSGIQTFSSIWNSPNLPADKSSTQSWPKTSINRRFSDFWRKKSQIYATAATKTVTMRMLKGSQNNRSNCKWLRIHVSISTARNKWTSTYAPILWRTHFPATNFLSRRSSDRAKAKMNALITSNSIRLCSASWWVSCSNWCFNSTCHNSVTRQRSTKLE